MDDYLKKIGTHIAKTVVANNPQIKAELIKQLRQADPKEIDKKLSEMPADIRNDPEVQKIITEVKQKTPAANNPPKLSVKLDASKTNPKLPPGAADVLPTSGLMQTKMEAALADAQKQMSTESTDELPTAPMDNPVYTDKHAQHLNKLFAKIPNVYKLLDIKIAKLKKEEKLALLNQVPIDKKYDEVLLKHLDYDWLTKAVEAMNESEIEILLTGAGTARLAKMDQLFLFHHTPDLIVYTLDFLDNPELVNQLDLDKMMAVIKATDEKTLATKLQSISAHTLLQLDADILKAFPVQAINDAVHMNTSEAEIQTTLAEEPFDRKYEVNFIKSNLGAILLMNIVLIFANIIAFGIVIGFVAWYGFETMHINTIFVFLFLQCVCSFIVIFNSESGGRFLGLRLRAIPVSSIRYMFMLLQGLFALAVIMGLRDPNIGSIIFGTAASSTPTSNDTTITISILHNFMLNCIAFSLSMSAIFLILPIIFISCKRRKKLTYRDIYQQELNVI